jgi:hypothetical protein
LIAYRLFQTLLAAAVLGILIAAWAIGRRSRKSIDQKPSPGRRTAIILLRLQALLPLPSFVFDNLDQRFLELHSFGSIGSGSIVFFSALLGEVLTVPVIWMWVRYGEGKERVIGVSTSVLCALLILLLVMIGGATA